MKNRLLFIFALITFSAFAQTGTIQGLVTDGAASGMPLPFADVYIKGTTQGATTDFDGNYAINGVEAGMYTLVFSFVGYETKTIPNVIVEEDDVQTINTELKESAAALATVVVEATSTVKESEKALLIEQKKADVVVESVGVEQLAKTGVTNAAAATEKIAGVTKSSGSSEVYIRGLGDRYLTTTLNNLPVPSDDIERKNIDLGLFGTNVIQNVSISKTFAASNFADQASGNIDVSTKKLKKDNLKIALSSGINTRVVNSNFQGTVNKANASLGFFDSSVSPSNTISNGKWNTVASNNNTNYGVAVSGGKKFAIGNTSLKVNGAISHKSKSEYYNGIFRQYLDNAYQRDFSDVEKFSNVKNTSALLGADLKISNDHKLSYNSLLVNRGEEILYEQGRSGEGRVADQFDENDDFGSFSRDQNFKQTLVWVNQLHGQHNLSDVDKLKWDLGYNIVNADEPNRVRNNANIHGEGQVEVIANGGFDQVKSTQAIEDREVNFRISDVHNFSSEDDDNQYKLKLGYDFRNKTRDFSSTFFGLNKQIGDLVFVDSVDNLASLLNQENITNGTYSVVEQEESVYDGLLSIHGAYANFLFEYGKFSGNAGLRYELDRIDMSWDTSNGFEGETEKVYNNILPSVNVKYALSDDQNLRFAASLTNTLPEFKEIAEFNYVSPTGQGTLGNPDIEKSDNLNVDFKYEYFPTSGQLVSGALFFKNIQNPINKALRKGSTGWYTYDNTADDAYALGLEVEGKFDVREGETYNLKTAFNFSYMFTRQNLTEDYQYSDVTTARLQGASDFIGNASLIYEMGEDDKKFVSTLTGNYASDKIAVLGSSTNAGAFSGTLFNNNIIEKGFVTLDFVAKKNLSEKLTLSFVAKNILDPKIRQTQEISTVTSVEDITVSEYRRGRLLTLGLSYIF